MTDNVHFSLSHDDRVATLTLDRPPLNIIDIPTIIDLREALSKISDTTSVVVLRAKGEKAFSAGVDIDDHTPDKIESMLENFHAVFRTLFQLPALTVAEVQGVALGGGAELPLLCDYVLAGDSAKFAFPEIHLACFPPVAMAILSDQIGPKHAADLILTGRKVKADEALAMGLVSAVVSSFELDAKLNDWIDGMMKLSPAVLKMTALALRKTAYPHFEKSLDKAEKLYLGDLAKCPDMEEGLKAFVEKRKPVWKS